MKYIRTKDDKIYEIIDETENGFELCSLFEKKMGCSCIMIKRLLGSNEKPTYRLADTIEEQVYHIEDSKTGKIVYIAIARNPQEVIDEFLKRKGELELL